MRARYEYVDLPPPTEQRITQIYVWVAKNADGSEGIISADLPAPDFPGKMRHMPLMSTKRHVAESLLPLVNKLMIVAVGKRQQPFTPSLVTFTRSDT